MPAYARQPHAERLSGFLEQQPAVDRFAVGSNCTTIVKR